MPFEAGDSVLEVRSGCCSWVGVSSDRLVSTRSPAETEELSKGSASAKPTDLLAELPIQFVCPFVSAWGRVARGTGNEAGCDAEAPSLGRSLYTDVRTTG